MINSLLKYNIIIIILNMNMMPIIMDLMNLKTNIIIINMVIIHNYI